MIINRGSVERGFNSTTSDDKKAGQRHNPANLIASPTGHERGRDRSRQRKKRENPAAVSPSAAERGKKKERHLIRGTQIHSHSRASKYPSSVHLYGFVRGKKESCQSIFVRAEDATFLRHRPARLARKEEKIVAVAPNPFDKLRRCKKNLTGFEAAYRRGSSRFERDHPPEG